MTAPTLHEIGEALYGSRWQSELARAMGMSPRHMRRFVAGEMPITPQMVAVMATIAGARLKQIQRIVRHLP